MSRADFYGEYALECLRVANHTNEPRTKTILIDMAQAWIKLAGQARRNQRIHLVYVAPTPSDLPASR